MESTLFCPAVHLVLGLVSVSARLPHMMSTLCFHAALYWGFLPHCFEAWPHDISELLVIGGMKVWTEVWGLGVRGMRVRISAPAGAGVCRAQHAWGWAVASTAAVFVWG
eukprot:364335-Chlamydomonas_euryale.AAC.8